MANNVIYTENGIKYTHDERLELCPFCGGYPDFIRTLRKIPLPKDICEDLGYEHEYTVVFVQCRNRDCRATSKELRYDSNIHKDGSEYDEVAKLWNRRVSK